MRAQDPKQKENVPLRLSVPLVQSWIVERCGPWRANFREHKHRWTAGLTATCTWWNVMELGDVGSKIAAEHSNLPFSEAQYNKILVAGSFGSGSRATRTRISLGA